MAPKNPKALYQRMYSDASEGKKVVIRQDQLEAFMAAVAPTNVERDEVTQLIRKGDLRIVGPRVFEDENMVEYVAYEPA